LVRPAIFDDYITALHVAHIAQALAERGRKNKILAAPVDKIPITGIAGCCARATTGHAAALPGFSRA